MADTTERDEAICHPPFRSRPPPNQWSFCHAHNDMQNYPPFAQSGNYPISYSKSYDCTSLMYECSLNLTAYLLSVDPLS